MPKRSKYACFRHCLSPKSVRRPDHIGLRREHALHRGRLGSRAGAAAVEQEPASLSDHADVHAGKPNDSDRTLADQT